MRSAGVFHPDFFYSPRRVTDTSQLMEIEIFRVTPNSAEWSADGSGMVVEPDVLIWKGRGRVQPNKDWRARGREIQFEYDAVHAVRVQIPIGRNELGAVWDPSKEQFVSFGADPVFVKDMRVHVVNGPVIGSEQLDGKDFYIRNAINSQNLWVYNLLCDTTTNGRREV